MSVAHRLYWNLADAGLESEFCRWIRDAHPILFKNLAHLFLKEKERGEE